MPFRSALSAPNQTTKRGGVYSAMRWVAALTPTIQLQFNPSVAGNGKPTGQITRTTQLSGSHNNLLFGMTVYITPSADYLSDLKNRPEDCLKTYVREVTPTSTILYIGWTSFQWGTSHYVTVVDNFEVHSKKTRIIGTTIYKNVSVAYRAPLPRITGVYATLSMTLTGNANISPTPTETAMTSGASISSRTWAKIINGTVTKAVSTSATPTIAMPTGIHWLHLTTTDSGGRANWFVMLVVVCPLDYSSVVSKLVAGTVTNDLNAGISADVRADAPITTLVPGSAALIFDDITYKDGTSEQVVKAFGWLDSDVNQEIQGDETYGVRTTYSTRLVGIRDAANTVRLPAFPFKFKASPTTWGQVTRCTVYDAIWYAVSEHSTIGNIAALDFPSNYTDYQYNPSLQIPEGILFDSLDTLAFFASGGMLNWSPNGEIYFRQSLLYDTSSSSRNAATVYGTYTTADAAVTRLNRPPVNKFPLSAIQGGFATWNTTTNTPRIYQTLAPQENTPAALLESVDGIILTKNLSDSAAKVEAGKLGVNHFFASTQPSTVGADFLAGYTTLEASCFQWHQFSIAAEETLDGVAFDSDTRLLCTQVTSDYNADEWGIVASAEFREETDGGDNYARETEFVPLGTTQPFPTYPSGDFTPYLVDFDTPSDYYGDEHDDQREGWEDPTLPPETAAQNPNNGTGVAETLYVPFRGGTINTATTTTLGADYLIRVTGFASLGASDWCHEFDFSGGFQGWTARALCDDEVTGSSTWGTLRDGGVGSVGGMFNSACTLQANQLWIRIGFGITTTITNIDYIGTGAQGNSADNTRMFTDGNIGTGSAFFVTNNNAPFYSGAEQSGSFTPQTISHVNILISAAWNGSSSGNAVLTGLTLRGTGTKPTFASGTDCSSAINGDAFFDWTEEDEEGTAYSGQGGLNLDGAGIIHSNAYNPSHTYEFTATGTGSVFGFSFFDNDSDYGGNENKFLKVEIIPL